MYWNNRGPTGKNQQKLQKHRLNVLKTIAAILFNKTSKKQINDAKILQHQNQRKHQTKQEHQNSSNQI